MTNHAIYNRLQDEISKKIFVNRFLFSYTGESVYHNNVLNEMGVSKRSFDEIRDILNQSNTVVIYGVGVIGHLIKMDIEGAELNALKGAAKTIKKHKRVLYALPG